MIPRILIVAYYFPPSGGAGVQRPAKWAKYLPGGGVEPTVLTVREGAYPHHDDSLLADVEGIPVSRTAAPDPFGLYGTLTGRTRQRAVADRTGRIGESPALAERLARWVRSNVFVPDARVGWVPFALAKAHSLHRERPFDVLLTTGPPHSAHLIGRRLKQEWGVPWLADFRDPWTDIHYADSLERKGLAERMDSRMERSVLQQADAIVTISPWLQRHLGERTSTPVHLIRNGFDAEDFESVRQNVSVETFDLVYVGTLFGVPAQVLDAIAELRTDGDAEHLRMRFIGEQPEGVAEAIEQRGLEAIVSVQPPIAHEKAVQEMAGASLLLLTVESAWSYANGVIPGKTYEYIASGRPVLGVGPSAGDAASILMTTGAGTMHAQNDVASIKQTLQTHYAAWKNGHPLRGASWEAALPYSRLECTRQLSGLVHSLWKTSDSTRLSRT